MANKATVYQKLNKVLGFQDEPTKLDIKPSDLNNLSDSDIENKRLEAQQTLFLKNQWKRIDNELYQKAVYYEPTRIASYYDYESMEYCLGADTQIVTPDGMITIKELADKGRDHEFIVYAYDHNLKKVVPAMARNAHYTRDEMTYKVTFDDGKFLLATHEHRLMKRDGTFCMVKDLKEGDSMMPFYRKSFYNNKKYNWVYTCNNNEGHNGWIAEHTLIAEWFNNRKIDNSVEEVHHMDFNGKNNLPENLLIMNINEHRAYHARLNNEKLWSNEEYRLKMSDVAKRKGKYKWNGARSGENNPAYFHIPFDLIIDTAKTHKTLKKTASALNVSYRKIQRDIISAGYNDWLTFLTAYGIEKSKYASAKATGDVLQLNHKIVSIEPYGVIPVYDLTVPGYKNFATDSIFSHNTPEIAVALDIFADEATTSNENGKILTIYSDSNRIKSELTDLFENIIDINTNLTSWARNVCKYGDNFVYLKIAPNQGILGVTQLPNIEITRSEPGFVKIASVDNYQDEKGTKFFWKDKGIDFNSFEVAHFRLLGDDRRLPYGTSLLEKSRRIWKQLLLAEDAMLVYRVTRAPERRIYKVFVGNMDDKDIDAYVDKIANNFKRVNLINPNNGQQDTRYNPLAVDQDYFIPVRDPQLPNPIDTLAGAQNLSEIADIEYIQKKLLAALRVPKAFIGFDESTGDGKNLAILDIRFARAIHRIQKSLIQELNKIAIIHLYLKGFEDDLDNFTLTLTNPSTQADLLKIEGWVEKVRLYKDAVSDAGNGYSAMSMTLAKKEIFGMSDDEIKLDIQRQVIERAGSEEVKVLSEMIKQTGLFRDIYRVYKINPDNMVQDSGDSVESSEEFNDMSDMGGDVGQDFTPDIGGEFEAPEGSAEPMEPAAPEETLAEITSKKLTTRNKNITETIFKTIKNIDKLLK